MLGRRDWRAAAILLSFLAGYLPWFYEDIDHRTMFLFYLLPDVPFMCLALAMGLGMVLGSRAAKEWRRIVGATVTGAYLVLVVANFAYFYPVLAAQTISYQQWHDRMWLRTCDPAQHRNEHHENAPCWI
jgi:dolichyl-phosphate-mannose--protein O-mannosyl transferase